MGNGDDEGKTPEKQPQDEYDRLVEGCEEFYFGPGAEPEGEKKSTPKATGDEHPEDAADKG